MKRDYMFGVMLALALSATLGAQTPATQAPGTASKTQGTQAPQGTQPITLTGCLTPGPAAATAEGATIEEGAQAAARSGDYVLQDATEGSSTPVWSQRGRSDQTRALARRDRGVDGPATRRGVRLGLRDWSEPARGGQHRRRRHVGKRRDAGHGCDDDGRVRNGGGNDSGHGDLGRQWSVAAAQGLLGAAGARQLRRQVATFVRATVAKACPASAKAEV